MKKVITAAAISALGLSLAACGGNNTQTTTAAVTEAATEATTTAEAKGEELKGAAEGFGGEVSVVLTVADGKITEAKLTGDQETPEIGGKALAELEQQIVAANGAEIDGVSGATITSQGAKNAVKIALGEEIEETEAVVETAAPVETVSVDGGVSLGLAWTSPADSKGFVQAVAVVQEDTILAAYLDEFQFMDAAEGIVGVPNSDADFGGSYAEGKVLISKRQNNEAYSANMANFAKATTKIADGFDTIQDFVVGKTVSEVAEIAGRKDKAVDAVSGATLAHTDYYLEAISEAAKKAQANPAVEFTGESSDLTLNVVLGAAHGTKCFSTAAALVDGEHVLNSYIDELQFMSADTEGLQGLAVETEDFTSNVAEGLSLVSKRDNDEIYSANMASHAGATRHIADGYQLIQNTVNGKTIAEVEELAGKTEIADAVAGSTLADTINYIALILEAAKA